MKYKLIKEYPGSPKLNTIVENHEKVNSANTLDKRYYYNGMKIQNYPEFWEPVVEKDYEILSYITINSEIIKYQALDINDDCNCDKYLKIHSIKRLSDGEIFTIGDKIFPNNKIYKFELKDNNLKIWHCDISFSTPIIEGPSGQPGNCSWIEGINNLKKIKQPLFTTEDGVDIFEGDSFCYVKFKENRFSVGRVFEIITAKIPGCIYEPQYEKYFSTKEKAEEYILMNKPILSLKEIYDLTDKNSGQYNESDLEKLVKQKLNK